MEHQILRQFLGRFKSVDTQPFRSNIPKGDAIPNTLENALATKTPFYKDEKGGTQHLAFQRLNDTEVELVQEPSPLQFKNDYFNQSIHDIDDSQRSQLQQSIFDYVVEDRKRGTRGFGYILINNSLKKAKLRQTTNAKVSYPGQFKFNSKDGSDAAEQARRMAMKFPAAKVKRLLEKFGAGERFEELERHVKKGLSAVYAETSRLNKKKIGEQYTAGHIGAVKNGYIHTPENMVVEEFNSNFSRQHKDDLPEEILNMFGAFKDWEQYVLYFLSEELQITKILTFDDKQKILGMGKYKNDPQDFEKVFRQREEIIEQSV